MNRRTLAAVVAGAATVLGMGAWAAQRPDPGTDPAPVDQILEAGLDMVGAAGAGAAVPTLAGVETEPGVVRFASGTLETRSTESWDLPVTYNDRVQWWIDFLKGKNRDHTHAWLEREGRYGAFIRSQLRARGMPEDLLYLGMIESGLSPKAYSKARAAGLWQFIAETGRRYGLEVSTYVDERRDPVRATDAALDYLSDLHDRFGSWYLAAAAYNTGENRVERVLRQRADGRKGDESLFWKIDDYLPRETRDYVPLMLAAGYIAKDPNRYGFYGIEQQAPLSYDEVKVPGGVALSTVADAAGVDEDAVSDLNPQLVRRMTPPDREWPVRVPVGSGAKLVASLNRLDADAKLATVIHRVRRGETLSHIAHRYGVDIDALRSSNAGIDPRGLQVGDAVRVPVAGTALAVGTAQPDVPSWTTYRVRHGDTLWDIAHQHGVSVSQIRSWNGIGNRIYPGQKLRLQA